MLKNIADDVAFLLVRKRIVDNEKREMYAYGMEVILLNVINLVIPFIISLIMGVLIHFIIFILVFIPLRISTGGYHAKESGICIIISTMLYIVSVPLSYLSSISYKNVVPLILFVFSILAIIIFAPVENMNNHLSHKSKKRNRLISLLLVSADSIAIILFDIFSIHIASNIMIFVILASALMIIGRFQNKTFFIFK